MLGVILAAALGQVGIGLDLPWSSGFSRSQLDRVDVASVVTIEGGERRSSRQELVSPGKGLPQSIPGNPVTVRVVTGYSSTGKGVKRGETLALVVPSLDGVADRITFKKGQKYLIFGF